MTLRSAQVAVVAILAWGTLAFGSVYAWAYWPLAVASLLAGITGIALTATRAHEPRGLILAMMVVAGGVLLQVLPLPLEMLERVSPNSLAALEQISPTVALGTTNRHPVSLQPSFTWTALFLFGSFALLLVGSTRLFSAVGATQTIVAITALGVVLSLAGVIQKGLYNGKIYGIWTTEMRGDPFGPFANKNHFAGWMLMALPLTLGLICARIARGMRGVKPAWRERILWLSSQEASQLVLLVAAAAVMLLALVLTMSRSGMAAFGLAIILMGWFGFRGRATWGRKALTLVALVGIVVVVVGMVGADTIIRRYAEADWGALNDRRGAWRDARNVAALFPWTGTGLNTYGVAMLLYQQHGLSRHYAQAHNDYLQLAAEGGLLLCIPIALCVVLLIRGIRQRMREDRDSSGYWIRAGAVVSLAAIAMQETVDFSLQMPGNAAMFAVVCAVAIHRRPAGLQARPKSSNELH